MMEVKSLLLLLIFCGVSSADSPLTCQCNACANTVEASFPTATASTEDETMEPFIMRRGKQGPIGLPGPEGPPGISPEVDYTQVEDMIWSKLLFIQKIKKVYPGAILTSNKRAYVVSSVTMTWENGEVYCEQLGAKMGGKELMKPQIRQELQTVLPGKWIGLSDIDTDGVWQWLDADDMGEHVVNFWATTEPNGGTNENCAHFVSTNSLNDNSCARELQVLCEIEV